MQVILNIIDLKLFMPKNDYHLDTKYPYFRLVLFKLMDDLNWHQAIWRVK